ncbi:hypothetical protein [Pontibacter pudoricolor]|uniref:hypothetical protein n=1 Tax=Pontibacter pudoricolor TaxID=2694930 RepID=UPI0013917450|nr:hypothetical protein [Pontibacter pudoricolor]
MKNKTFTPPHFSLKWLKLFLVFLVSASTFLWSCDKAKDSVQPDALTTSQVQTVKSGKDKEDKDNKYKTDRTGQYVSKDVQVTGYEDGRERPLRPKHDAAGDLGAYSEVPCDPCGPGSGGVPTPPTSAFVSSEGLWDLVNAPSGDIYALRIIKGDHQYIVPSEGHIKLNADLNRGSGGKYIYLTFTRNPQFSYENDGAHSAGTYDTPLTNLKVVSYTQFGYINPFNAIAPGDNYRHLYRFIDGNSIAVDLNDGAGGKYIFGHVSREPDYGTPIKEVGILYGNSSAIQPPAGWVKVPGDLNENAGGDYIYFCYKK